MFSLNSLQGYQDEEPVLPESLLLVAKSMVIGNKP
jgi:hypothetical protein